MRDLLREGAGKLRGVAGGELAPELRLEARGGDVARLQLLQSAGEILELAGEEGGALVDRLVRVEGVCRAG